MLTTSGIIGALVERGFEIKNMSVTKRGSSYMLLQASKKGISLRFTDLMLQNGVGSQKLSHVYGKQSNRFSHRVWEHT